MTKPQILFRRIEMKKFPVIISIVLILSLVLAGTALAITDGEVDGDGHPQVGFLVMDVGGKPAWRCSATLLSPTVVLTAGHCTSNSQANLFGMRLWLIQMLRMNQQLSIWRETSSKLLKFHTLIRNRSMVQRCRDCCSGGTGSELEIQNYVELPEVDHLDQLKTQRGKQKADLYCCRLRSPAKFSGCCVEGCCEIRMVADPRLIQINTPGFTVISLAAVQQPIPAAPALVTLAAQFPRRKLML